jgi:hypothetical protein
MEKEDENVRDMDGHVCVRADSIDDCEIWRRYSGWGEMVVGWAAFVHTLSAEMMMSRLDLALHAWQLVGDPFFSYPSGSIWVLCCSDAAASMGHVVS